MVQKEILDYIKNCKEKGFSDSQIKEALLKAGWAKQDVENAFKDNLPVPPAPHAAGNTAIDKYPINLWDTFEHILMFISLYVMSTSIALILHNLVDIWLPKFTNNYFNNYGYYGNSYDTHSTETSVIKWSLAALIVSLPIFAYFFLDVSKRTIANPQLRHLYPRRLLIYLTLIVTFVIIVYKLVTLIHNFLDGDLTMNLFLHFIITIGTSGSIFSYYYRDIKHDVDTYA